jgi:hypothetical protein
MTKPPPKPVSGNTAPLPAVLSRLAEPGEPMRLGGSADRAEADKRTGGRKPE